MKRARAVFTMQRDEDVFLPIWLKYYSRHFDGQDIYVLDHASTNGIVEEMRAKYTFNPVRYDYETFDDWEWRLKITIDWQQKLLERYEAVLVTDPDEIVFAYEGLDRYIATMSKPTVHCAGIAVVHSLGLEQPIDLTRSILSQRSWCDTSGGKQLLSRVPLRWGIGLHHAEPEGTVDPDLLFIHLHKMDYQVSKVKNERAAKYKWWPRGLALGIGYQCRCVGRDFDRFFFSVENALRPVPAELKQTDAF